MQTLLNTKNALEKTGINSGILKFKICENFRTKPTAVLIIKYNNDLSGIIIIKPVFTGLFNYLVRNKAAAPRTPPESPYLAFLITGTFALRIRCFGNAFGKAS